ncbi:MAG: molybdopterin-binding protein [Bacillota bacterium]|nr:molybdopterin-binding protein [Bacillota bacterium]
MKALFLETEKSVGKVICHDITKIEKGAFKGALFKKGHLIREEDVEILLNLGKNHIYSLELEPGELHEDEAGLRIARALQGDGLTLNGPSEGRLDLTALQRGLLKVDVERLNKINLLPDVVIATLHTNTPVEIEEKVAGAKVIPLVVNEEVVRQVEEICKSGPALLRILPYGKQKIGVVITGREVIEGRVQDGFAPVLNEKASFFGLEPPEILYAGDNAEIIANSVEDLLSRNCEIIIVTGGMSVDPDDVTPSGIKKAGARVIKYGAPALPGAMFLLAYKGKTPILGIPACAMYFRTTILDIILPRILAGEILEIGDIAGLGHGGLCRRCEKCLYPNCSFGKGVV